MKERTQESLWLYAASGALLLGGPVVHYFAVNHYPLRPESVILPLLFASVGAATALLAGRIGRVPGALLFAGLLFVFLDLQTDLHDHVPLLILLIICGALAFVFQLHRAKLTVITLSVFYLAAVPGVIMSDHGRFSRRFVSSGPAPPLLVHLILDEQWGPGGLRVAGDSATAAYLEEFYRQRGFQIFPGAYSHWLTTTEAIPEMLSLGSVVALDTVAMGGMMWPARNYRLRTNPYFSRLRQMGYQIRVYENTYLDFCSSRGVPVLACDVAPGNSIANIAGLEGAWTRRANLAARFYLNTNSQLYTRVRTDRTVWRRSLTGGALTQLDRMSSDLRTGPEAGVAYFVHLLLPHQPFEVDSLCRIIPDLSQRVGNNQLDTMAGPVWRTMVERYSSQVRCAHRRIATLVQIVDSMAGPGKSIIIVNGDHGSRLLRAPSDAKPFGALNASKLASSYSTLLAVRLPGTPAAVRQGAIPIQEFISELAHRNFQSTPDHQWRHFVHLLESDSAHHSTLRMLNVEDMPWARAASNTN